MYLFSKGFSGQGTFLAHLYCLQLCIAPLVTVNGALLLIPATDWLVLLLVSIVCLVYLTAIVLILPMVILVVVLLVELLFLTEGGGSC